MQLDIILRTHDQGSIHGRQVDYSKKEMVRRCTFSLFNALNGANLTIVDDHSSKSTLDLLAGHGKLIRLEETGNNASLAKVFELAAESKADAVYLVEDDYLHHPYAISEMLETWPILTEGVGLDICVNLVDCPANYATDGNARNGSYGMIVGGIKRAWRTNTHTGGTFCTTPAVINKYWGAFDNLIQNWPRVDENDTWNKIWEKHIPLFTPLIPLAYHLSELHPFHPFDDLWDANKIAPRIESHVKVA